MSEIPRGTIPLVKDRVFAACINAPRGEIVGKGGKGGRHVTTHQFRIVKLAEASDASSPVCNLALSRATEMTLPQQRLAKCHRALRQARLKISQLHPCRSLNGEFQGLTA